MQRAPFVAPAPAQSPPLHHPIPQHVSSIPMMRTPPPAMTPQSSYQAAGYMPHNPYQPAPAQGGSGTFGPQVFGNFVTDPAAQMGIHVGKNAMFAGHNYLQQNVNRLVSIPALKHHFNVSNEYVINKLALVLYPWRHRSWSRQQVSASNGQIVYLPPRDDINSPDMYIPVMSIVTYILLSTVLAGFRGSFHPELLGSITTSAVAVILFEILCLKLAMYILNIGNDSLIDLIDYAGYKFVGVITTLVSSEVFSPGKGTSGWVGWTVFLYTFLSNAFFLLRSLKYVLLPDPASDRAGTMPTVARHQRNRRTQFLFIYSYIIQFIFMWILSRADPVASTVVSKVGGKSA